MPQPSAISSLSKRERPYAELALARRLAQSRVLPTSFRGRLAWFAGAWAMEPVPEHLHSRGVWHDEAGGSRLGSPMWSADFVSYLCDAAMETDEDGSFKRPLAAALEKLRCDGSEFTVKVLWRLGMSGCAWEQIALALGYDIEVFQGYLSDALVKLWTLYQGGDYV